MSIIEQTSPLNLVRRIAIVTGASSTVGAAVCRTLLKHNACVLGIDTVPIHSTLNARLGTHMQFYQGDVTECSAIDIIRACRTKFEDRSNIDALINLVPVEGDHLTDEVVKIMTSQNGGAVLNVVGNVDTVADGAKAADTASGHRIVGSPSQPPNIYCIGCGEIERIS
ncbi:hypothetical protein LTR16_004612 [Cryomyces antarcticus]|uniref:Uncharacterized protein n=1 Tax=Cryomyces antarcticus TaxID=329879 RepID=A0ABR0LPY1_9PEZI|nr:hypothetical protein LTR60_004734 [Cryomyces antarcticus]KAK5012325.1 hypothetical protein LTR39_004208 [Cryomyces antarcticus]KAK5200870.1 hypothetical protein LTR16_004612 [Cryomyces antarcticus]